MKLKQLISAIVASSVLSSPVLAKGVAWNEIKQQQLEQIPYLKVDKNLVLHQHEKRGFVTVPLDYDDPNGRKIAIFYRLMPAFGSHIADQSKPILMVMNGGPGAASSGYRPVDYDYQQADPQQDPRDRYKSLAKYFRILAVDQRGTGFSAPLNLDSDKLSAAVIAKLFDADEQARDHGAVAKAVIKDGQPFFILARSYGGMIGFQYMMRPELPQPNGIVLSSAIQPHTDGSLVFVKRRAKQKQLHVEWLKADSKAKAKMTALRQSITKAGLNHEVVNQLWPKLGKGVGWEKELSAKVDSLIAMGGAQAYKDLTENQLNTVNPLNYVLSSAALTPGFTDRTLTRFTSKKVPMDHWMINENWTLNQIGLDGSWRTDFVAAVDVNPPPVVSVGSISDIKKAMATQQVLFSFGKSDAFLEYKTQLNYAKRFAIKGHTEFVVFEGGHGAAFSPDGAEYVEKWAKKRMK